MVLATWQSTGLPGVVTTTAADYIRRLATVSAYHRLQPETPRRGAAPGPRGPAPTASRSTPRCTWPSSTDLIDGEGAGASSRRPLPCGPDGRERGQIAA